jgi:hypothetical protein
MIKAYLESFSSHYEGEDIEINFAVFEDGKLLEHVKEFQSYQKPALVGQIALNTLLVSLHKFEGQKIQIIINDAAVYEQVNETSTNPNRELITMAKKTRSEIEKYGENLEIYDVSYDYNERVKFSEALKKG